MTLKSVEIHYKFNPNANKTEKANVESATFFNSGSSKAGESFFKTRIR